MGYKVRWNIDKNANILIEENSFENVVCKMTAILSWPHFSDYILHFQWNQVKCHKVSLMIIKSSLQSCTDGSLSSSGSKPLHEPSFAKFNRSFIDLWPSWNLYPSNKSTGDTVISRLANFQMQEIWHDFCLRSFIWHPGFDTIITFASSRFVIWTRLLIWNWHTFLDRRLHEIYMT